MADQGDYVHKIWSLSSQRFLELELPEDAATEAPTGKSIFLLSLLICEFQCKFICNCNISV